MKIRLLLPTALAVAATLVVPGLSSTAFANPVVQPGWFANPYVRSGFTCAPNEVMLGIHVNQQKVICAWLNYGYQVASRYVDPPHGTQVLGNMHGCAPNYIVQGLTHYGLDESLTCVSLKNYLGQALALPLGYVDGPGPGNNGTQSTIYGLNSPTMHVCSYNYAMAGIHELNNDLYCVG